MTLLSEYLLAQRDHDIRLCHKTLQSIPSCVIQLRYKEIHLDAAYDSEYMQTALFTYYYISKNSFQSKKQQKEKTISARCRFIEPVHFWLHQFRVIFVRYCYYVSLAQFAAAQIIFKKV